MVRIKRGVSAHKRRKNVLKHTKGFRWGRKSKYKAAKDALLHAWTYSYRDRKVRKRTFRQLWQTHISSASKAQGISYSKFIKALKDNKIELDRKILADLAENNPEIFQKIIEQVAPKIN
ncbi:50S ribosomal protein L20 [Patescibacteria group bacterium]|nr:50S ribosomal protein L20 [Patescibacteria group bacterium]